VKTISLKKVAVVAVASLGFGLLSVVPARAAAGTTAAITLTTLSRAGTATTPLIQGTAFTSNITAVLAVAAAIDGESCSIAVVITDPTGAAVTTGTISAVAGPIGVAGVMTATGQTITITVGVGGLAAATYVVGSLSFTPTMGGNYAITSTTTGTACGGAKTEMNGTADASRGLLYTQGITVTQGVTRGSAGTAKIANQAKVTVSYPEAEGTTYKAVSSGIGAIIGATPTDAVNTNISGLATDFSAGLTTVTTTNNTAHNNVFTLSSTVAGTQTVTLTTVDTTTGLASALYSIVVTWSAIAALAPSASIVRIAPTATAANAQLSTGATANAYTTTADAIPYAAPKAIGSQVATIQVILVNSDGTAATQGHTVTASVTGAGFVQTDVAGAAAAGTARSESQVLVTGNENVAWIHISGDGTAGTGTIGITVTDVATGTSTALPSKTVTFYGAVTAISAAATFTIGKAGQNVGTATAGRITANELGKGAQTITTTSTPAFVVTTKDSGARNSTAANAPTIISSDANVATGGTCVLDTFADADYSATPSAGGTTSVGVYNCNWSAAANAVSGAKATLTARIADPASTTGGFLTTTVAVSIGGSISTETVALDKTSYAPGEAMVITRTAKDSAGNPVFDGAASGALTFNKPVGGTAVGAGLYIGGSSASATSVAKAAVFAPSIAGAFSASMTGGDAAATVRTASSSVTDANAGILTQIDALNAKIVALNALIAKIMKKLGVK